MDRRERCSSGTADLGELMAYHDQSSKQVNSLVVPGAQTDLAPQDLYEPHSAYEQPNQQQQPQVQPCSFYGQAPKVTSSS